MKTELLTVGNDMAKDRKDTSLEATRAMLEALKGKQPPKHVQLRPKDKPFWKDIINARAEWTDIDLVLAANLARCMADIEDNQKYLDAEGNVIMNQRGTPVMNPRFAILEQLSRRSVCLAAKLQVHAAATIGESKLSRGKNTEKRKTLENLNEDDDLIARPIH